MTFPAVPLDLQCDLDLSGTWTSATSYLYQREGVQAPVTITRGRPDGTSKAPPGSSAFEANNRDGRWSPKNPAGAWYGQLQRNTPVRFSVPAASNYLRLEALTARAYVNDTGGGSPLGISGSIEMRIQVALTDWQGGVLAAKWDGGGCWFWQLNASGTLTFGWNDSGVAFHQVISSVPVPFTRSMMALRVTMDATTGNVTFYTGATIGGTFTQLGAVASGSSGAATSVAVNHSSPLVVGYSFDITPAQVYGRVAEYKLLNGIGGTVAADGVFSAQAAGATSWTDSAGNAWTSSPVSARDYRYHGQLSSLPPTWDQTGKDVAVKVTSGGVLRRLGQGSTPTQSPIRRAIALQAGTLAPVQYWPCEDATGATALGSATGGPLMQFDGSPKLATDSTFICSAPLPQLNGSRWHGQVPAYSGAGSIVVRFPLKVGALPASKQPLVRLITTGTATEVTFSVDNSGFGWLAGNNSGGAVFGDGPFFALASSSFSGTPGWMSIELRPSGGTVDVSLVMLTPGGASGFTLVSDSFSGSVGNVTDVYVNPPGLFADTVVGHMSVQADWVTMFSLQQPLDAWIGEAAGVRFARVCGENGITARVLGPAATTALMGQQPVDTVLNILQECEDADRGLIYEPRQVLGLAYRTLGSMLNQSPLQLDYSQATLGGTGTALEPYYDDQWVRNDETVTRGSSGSGSSQGAVYQYQLNDGSPMSIDPVAGIGDYDNSDTINCESDAAVPHLASWIVHAGTVDEARWPVIPVNLARPAIQGGSLYYPLLGLDVGDYLQLLNMLGVIVADPVRQLIPGLKESAGGFHHVVEWNAIAESPYEVAVFDDLVHGRADTDGSALAKAATAGATTLQVATTGPSGIAWTTAAGDFPVDIAASGERITVTAVAATAAASLGIADGTFETGVSQWQAFNGTLVQSGAQHHSGSFSAQVTASTSVASTYLRPVPADWVPVIPGQSYTATAWVDAGQSGCTFGAVIDWYDAASNFLSSSSGPTSSPGAFAWTQYTVTGTAPAGAALARYGPTMAPTTIGNYYYADDITFTTPAQAFTVTRSVNGVSKAQAAGTDVRLWFPPIFSLI